MSPLRKPPRGEPHRYAIGVPQETYEKIRRFAVKHAGSMSKALLLMLGAEEDWMRSLPNVPPDVAGGHRRLHRTAIECRIRLGGAPCPQPFYWRGEKRCACATGISAGRKGARAPSIHILSRYGRSNRP